jgi:hypothetical protein
MTLSEPSGTHIEANIQGSNSGMIAVGQNIQQHEETQNGSQVDPQALLEDWLAQYNALKQMIQIAQVPDEKKVSALVHAQDLEDNLRSGEPDVTMLEAVKKWFLKNLPALAGTVTGLVVHPLVGKLVEAGGNALASQLFGPQAANK